jgi:choline transport protein
VSMYALFHPDFTVQHWQVFVAYIICIWACCFIVLFANRALPSIESIGGFLVLAGVVITILVCAILPHTKGMGYATSDFVWSEWQNETGYQSNGFVFCLGLLNGAFAVGTPDVISHLAEEVPKYVVPFLFFSLHSPVLQFTFYAFPPDRRKKKC